LLQNILPGIDGIDPLASPEEQLRAGVEANVRWTIHQIMDTPEARARHAEGVLR
jgi:hypothetical protein